MSKQIAQLFSNLEQQSLSEQYLKKNKPGKVEIVSFPKRLFGNELVQLIRVLIREEIEIARKEKLL